MNELKAKFGYDMGQQYCPPRCFELAGKTLRLVFDGFEAAAAFIDDKKLVWSRGEAREETEYWCLKAADRIYLLSFGLAGDKCMTLILDTEARLVTLDETGFDEAQKPVKAFFFGAVAEEGKALPSSRHEITRDLAGNAFRWVFCDTYWHVETYHETTHDLFTCFPEIKGTFPYRAVKITDTLYYTMNGDDKESFNELMNVKNLTCVARSVIGGTGGKALPLGAFGSFEE